MIDINNFVASIAYAKVIDISAATAALCLSGLSSLNNRYIWLDDGEPITDMQWDELKDMIDLANGEIMASLVGMIIPHVMATASAFKFIPCDGGIYNKSDYPLLYAAIDTTYIISGSQFRVPDMRDRVPVGTGNNYALDDSGGSDDVTLDVSEIPAHSHTYQQYTFGIDIESVGVPDPTGVGQPTFGVSTSSVGGGASHENRMPFRAINWAIIAG